MHRRGLHGLCAYALLAAGQATNDPRLNPKSPFMAEVIEKLVVMRGVVAPINQDVQRLGANDSAKDNQYS